MAPEDAFPKPEYIVPSAGKRGMTPLHHVAYLNDADAVRTELERGAAVDARDDNGWTPLHWSIDMAQAWGEPERVVSLLLQAGASPNAADDDGFTVRMMACGRNNEAILDQLIKAGADVHRRSAETSPLHEAAHCNFVQGIERLMALGADPHQANAWGLTPEQDAAECGFDESVAVFRSARPAT